MVQSKAVEGHGGQRANRVIGGFSPAAEGGPPERIFVREPRNPERILLRGHPPSVVGSLPLGRDEL